MKRRLDVTVEGRLTTLRQTPGTATFRLGSAPGMSFEEWEIGSGLDDPHDGMPTLRIPSLMMGRQPAPEGMALAYLMMLLRRFA